MAAALPLPVADVSTERRLPRFLANRAVVVGELWATVLPALLAGQAGREVSLVFDPTPHQDRATIVVLGLVDHKRVLPVAWRVLPQQEPWPEELLVVAHALAQAVAAALPPGCVVTLLADRGLTSPELMALCAELGWHYVLRVTVSAATSNRVIVDGRARALGDLVCGPGQRWRGTVTLFKKAGWRVVELTIWWQRRASEPWVLVSDRPAGSARVREYRRRARAEATDADCKRRGWDIERTKVTAHDHLDRLLVVLHLALWWTPQLGLRAIRAGQRRCFDRADRRDLSLRRLGLAWFHDLLQRDRCPPLPFHRCHGQWRFVWLS